MRNDQESADFYATFLGLSDEERAELQRITLDDDFVQAAIGTYPVDWRRCQDTGTPCQMIRRTFLVRILINFFKRTPNGASGNVATAFSLWLCDCVERYADEYRKVASGQ